MKNRVQNLLLLFALVAGTNLMPIRPVAAQSLSVLYSFTNHNDGANPLGLLSSGQTLYGAATFGGSSSNGTVFRVNSDGSSFTNLYSFTATDSLTGTNIDGAEPNALILSGQALYGTTTMGGSSGNGTVFALNTAGTGFKVLYSFTALDAATDTTNSDGANPYCGLVLRSNILYGTAQGGGSAGNGTVFALNTDGTGFTNLHNFSDLDAASSTTNGDGASPYADLVLGSNILYGTAQAGGSAGNGTVFALNTDGTGFTNLHNFSALDAATGTTNSDGAGPLAGLVLLVNRLYGAGYSGGGAGNGNVFALNTDGTGFTNLHNFSALDAATSTTNSDGANPTAGLILSGTTLYGTAYNGGSGGNGTVFVLNTDGTSFINLHNFTVLDPATTTINTDGANPATALILSGSVLLGTAFNGGSAGNGTLFSISLPLPQLTAIRSGSNLILTWPTTATGFTLQSTTNLASPSLWTPVAPPPVIVNGLNNVTNPISGNQRFYRLIQ